VGYETCTKVNGSMDATDSPGCVFFHCPNYNKIAVVRKVHGKPTGHSFAAFSQIVSCTVLAASIDHWTTEAGVRVSCSVRPPVSH
jgi:hypothetical protein